MKTLLLSILHLVFCTIIFGEDITLQPSVSTDVKFGKYIVLKDGRLFVSATDENGGTFYVYDSTTLEFLHKHSSNVLPPNNLGDNFDATGNLVLAGGSSARQSRLMDVINDQLIHTYVSSNESNDGFGVSNLISDKFYFISEPYGEHPSYSSFLNVGRVYIQSRVGNSSLVIFGENDFDRVGSSLDYANSYLYIGTESNRGFYRAEIVDVNNDNIVDTQVINGMNTVSKVYVKASDLNVGEFGINTKLINNIIVSTQCNKQSSESSNRRFFLFDTNLSYINSFAAEDFGLTATNLGRIFIKKDSSNILIASKLKLFNFDLSNYTLTLIDTFTTPIEALGQNGNSLFIGLNNKVIVRPLEANDPNILSKTFKLSFNYLSTGTKIIHNQEITSYPSTFGTKVINTESSLPFIVLKSTIGNYKELYMGGLLPVTAHIDTNLDKWDPLLGIDISLKLKTVPNELIVFEKSNATSSLVVKILANKTIQIDFKDNVNNKLVSILSNEIPFILSKYVRFVLHLNLNGATVDDIAKIRYALHTDLNNFTQVTLNQTSFILTQSIPDSFSTDSIKLLKRSSLVPIWLLSYGLYFDLDENNLLSNLNDILINPQVPNVEINSPFLEIPADFYERIQNPYKDVADKTNDEIIADITNQEIKISSLDQIDHVFNGVVQLKLNLKRPYFTNSVNVEYFVQFPGKEFKRLAQKGFVLPETQVANYPLYFYWDTRSSLGELTDEDAAPVRYDNNVKFKFLVK